MEHESFENDDIARKLNKHFVSIKVDRKERLSQRLRSTVHR